MLRFSVYGCIKYKTYIFCQQLEHDIDGEGKEGVKRFASYSRYIS